jgi:hypothetical protein
MDEFRVEVGRRAHELSVTHGWTALSYAERMAAEAADNNDLPTSAFWTAVAASLRPRQNSN